RPERTDAYERTTSHSATHRTAEQRHDASGGADYECRHFKSAQRQTRERNPMSQSLTWTNPEDIAIALADKFPDVDPLTVRFTDLYKWVINLGGFKDDPKNSNEKKLEAIQMAWYEEWQDRKA